MALAEAYAAETDATLNALAQQPIEPEPPAEKRSAWNIVPDIPKALAAGAAEFAGNAEDALRAIGRVTGLQNTDRNLSEMAPAFGNGGTTDAEELDRIGKMSGYRTARELAPDPMTAGKAEQLVFGLTKGVAKGATAVMTLGPYAGAAAFGGSEGLTALDELQKEGVDQKTAREVAAVTGVGSGLAMMLPVVGKTIPRSIGLMFPAAASYMAQMEASKRILEGADYGELAQRYDPLDPWGLALSVLPGGVIAAAAHGLRIRAAKTAEGKPGETPQETPEPSTTHQPNLTPDQVDAVMVHNLTLANDMRELTPPEERVLKPEPEPMDVQQTVANQLKALGVPEQEAMDKGLLWDSFFNSMAEKTGRTPRDLMDEYFGGINKGDETDMSPQERLNAALTRYMAHRQEEFSLEPHTAADLAARQRDLELAQQGDAEAIKRMERRYEADAMRESFALTGSDRAADTAGQGSLFQSLLHNEAYGQLPDTGNKGRAIDGPELTALRRAASVIERPEDGVFLYVTEDGKAVASGPKGARVPKTFIKFAEDHNLRFVAQRNVGIDRSPHGQVRGQYSGTSLPEFSPKTKPMPPKYRESGAMYFGERLGGKFPDRTGKTLFQSAAPKVQTDTHEFKRWFGDSKVVDAEGKPLVVYHGTDASFSVFDSDSIGTKTDGGLYGEGFYFSPNHGNGTKLGGTAGAYAASNDGGNIMPVYLRIENPLIVASAEWKVKVDRTKYDGVIVEDAVRGQRGPVLEYVVFHPEQIKSAIGNRGTFDPNNPNILYQKVPTFYSELSKRVEDLPMKSAPSQGWKDTLKGLVQKGQIKQAEIEATGLNDWLDLQQGKVSKEQVQEFLKNNGVKVMAGQPLFQGEHRGYLEFGPQSKMSIALLSEADKSTFLHESGHFFLEVMNDLAKTTPELQGMMGDVFKWMGVTPEQWAKMSLNEKRPYHEQWARGFESYLRDGKAPNSRLREAFARFRDWLLELYHNAASLNVTLSDEVRSVMDRMLTSQKEHPSEAPREPAAGPPPPSGEAPAAVSELDHVLASGEPNLGNSRPIDHPQIRAEIQHMGMNEVGWDQVGGRLIRTTNEYGDEEISRTEWIPRAEWWPDRPTKYANSGPKLTDGEVMKAVEKWLEGKELNALEQKTIDYMHKIANDRLDAIEQMGADEFGNRMEDVVQAAKETGTDVEPTTENVFDTEALKRAMELDPDAYAKAAEAYDVHDDDALFMGEIRSIINEHIQKAENADADQGSPAGTGEEASLANTESGGNATDGSASSPRAQAARLEAQQLELAQRLVDTRPDMPVAVTEDGTHVTLKQMVDDAVRLTDEGTDTEFGAMDVDLIQAAVDCFLSSGGV